MVLLKSGKLLHAAIYNSEAFGLIVGSLVALLLAFYVWQQLKAPAAVTEPCRVPYSSPTKKKAMASRLPPASRAATSPKPTRAPSSPEHAPAATIPVPPLLSTEAVSLSPPTPVGPPQPPVDEFDDRPPIQPLLEANAKSIALLRSRLSDDPLFDHLQHDDFWILRFLLSHKKSVPAALKAARTTLVWRKSRGMDALSAQLRAAPAVEHPYFVHVYRIHVRPGGINLVTPDHRRGPCLIAAMIGFDYAAVMRDMSREDYERYMLVINEWAYLECDRVSRATGRLTKACRFVQCKGFSVRSLNREWLNMDGAIAKEMEDCYPQGLGLILCLDPPSWALAMWRVVKFLFPARMVEKVDLLPISATKDLHKRALRFISLEDLPKSHGGRREAYTCPVTGAKGIMG